jgi:hypothetical protein
MSLTGLAFVLFIKSSVKTLGYFQFGGTIFETASNDLGDNAKAQRQQDPPRFSPALPARWASDAGSARPVV